MATLESFVCSCLCVGNQSNGRVNVCAMHSANKLQQLRRLSNRKRLWLATTSLYSTLSTTQTQLINVTKHEQDELSGCYTHNTRRLCDSHVFRGCIHMIWIDTVSVRKSIGALHGALLRKQYRTHLARLATNTNILRAFSAVHNTLFYTCIHIPTCLPSY